MSKFSLDPKMNFEVTALFIAKGADTAVTGKEISFHHEAFGDLANLETFPDLYFVVYKNDMPIFKSQVMKDVDLLAIAI